MLAKPGHAVFRPLRAPTWPGAQRHRAAGPNKPRPHALDRAGYRTHGIGKFPLQPILAPARLRMPDSNAFWTLPESRDWTGPFYGFAGVDLLIGESVAS